MNGEGRSLDGHNPRSFETFLIVVLCLIAVFQLATIRPGLLDAEEAALYSLDLVTVFSIGYGGFLLFWPFGQARYLLPLIPVYLYLLVCGLRTMNRFVSNRSQAAATVTATVVIVVLASAYLARFATSNFGPSPDAWDSPSARELYTLVEKSTPQSAVIVASAPRVLALYTGRHAAQFPEPLNTDSLTKYVAKIGATYLLVARAGANRMVSLCASACANEPVFSNSNYVLYMLSPEFSPVVK